MCESEARAIVGHWPSRKKNPFVFRVLWCLLYLLHRPSNDVGWQPHIRCTPILSIFPKKKEEYRTSLLFPVKRCRIITSPTGIPFICQNGFFLAKKVTGILPINLLGTNETFLMVPSATKLTKKLIRPTTFLPQYDGVQRDYYRPRNKKETGNLLEYLLCTVQIGQTSGKSSVSSWYSSFPYTNYLIEGVPSQTDGRGTSYGPVDGSNHRIVWLWQHVKTNNIHMRHCT